MTLDPLQLLHIPKNDRIRYRERYIFEELREFGSANLTGFALWFVQKLDPFRRH
jgi:hypothetical protein